MKRTENLTSVRLLKKHATILKNICEKEGSTQVDYLGKIIEEYSRINKTKGKLKAKLKIEDMSSEEALVYLERKIESLEKSMSFLVGIIKTQEREILNPILTETKNISGQNQEIIHGLQSIK